jgi:hypothetical protein
VARRAANQFLVFTEIIDQMNHKKNFESLASQRFQNFSWFGFKRKMLDVLTEMTISYKLK